MRCIKVRCYPIDEGNFVDLPLWLQKKFKPKDVWVIAPSYEIAALAMINALLMYPGLYFIVDSIMPPKYYIGAEEKEWGLRYNDHFVVVNGKDFTPLTSKSGKSLYVAK